MQPKSIASLLLFFALLFSFSKASAQIVDMVGPRGSGAYGTTITVLSNGNYVVTDPYYSEGGIDSIGAVYLYNGSTNALVSVLKGSTKNDWVGNGGATALVNGNFVVSSPNWNNGSIKQAGAATWCDGNIGMNGVVSIGNSLIGSTTGDQVGELSRLTNGNYVVSTPNWSNGNTSNVGAVTLCNGTTGMAGIINSNNSLVGTTANDRVGHVNTLPNGNYVVASSYWSNGTVANAGAVTWCSGTTAITGTINSNNSLTGTTSNDMIGLTIRVLPNGNYVVESGEWNNLSGAVLGEMD